MLIGESNEKLISLLAGTVVAASSLTAFNAQALTHSVHTIKVGQYITYGYGHGGATNEGWIRMNAGSSAPECPGGFYIKAEDRAAHPEWETMIISAFHSEENLQIGAYTDESEQWAANPTKTCRVNYISLVRNPI